jgi:cytochrome c biogenesis protein CcmG, thiol:disulfide interchange protein DsbE
MNLYVKGGIVALVMAAGIFFWYRAKEPSLPVNQTPSTFKLIDQMETNGVPEVDLAKLDGSKIKLSDYRGKIVIVNFWASWCNPCVEEFPSMVKLVSQFNGDVVILAISEDDQSEDIKTFTKAMGLPKPHFEVVWDQEKRAMKDYGVEKLPESFLVGRDGKLVRKVLGIENWASEDAVSYFKMLIAGQKPSAPAKSGH